MVGLLFDDSENLHGRPKDLWTKEHTDILFNMFLSGAYSLRRIAEATGRNNIGIVSPETATDGVNAVKRRIWEFCNDYRDKNPIDYAPNSPTSRESRVRCRWNENERRFLREYKKNNLPIDKLVPIMQRTLEEIEKVWNEHEPYSK